jgi:repressor LexA
MIDDGIIDGDLVGVKSTPEALDGQVVLARLDGELTIKRLWQRQGELKLLPRNRAYASIKVHPSQDFAVEGVFCGLIRQA